MSNHTLKSIHAVNDLINGIVQNAIQNINQLTVKDVHDILTEVDRLTVLIEGIVVGGGGAEFELSADHFDSYETFLCPYAYHQQPNDDEVEPYDDTREYDYDEHRSEDLTGEAQAPIKYRLASVLRDSLRLSENDVNLLAAQCGIGARPFPLYSEHELTDILNYYQELEAAGMLESFFNDEPRNVVNQSKKDSPESLAKATEHIRRFVGDDAAVAIIEEAEIQRQKKMYIESLELGLQAHLADVIWTLQQLGLPIKRPMFQYTDLYHLPVETLERVYLTIAERRAGQVHKQF